MREILIIGEVRKIQKLALGGDILPHYKNRPKIRISKCINLQATLFKVIERQVVAPGDVPEDDQRFATYETWTVLSSSMRDFRISD